jgi:hypothetical protein
MLLVATANDRLQISSQLDGRRNKMPTINENQFFTVLVEWEVDPSQQQAFVDAIADLVEQHIENDTGFVSASFHASEDGQRVINYAQWRSGSTVNTLMSVTTRFFFEIAVGIFSVS